MQKTKFQTSYKGEKVPKMLQSTSNTLILMAVLSSHLNRKTPRILTQHKTTKHKQNKQTTHVNTGRQQQYEHNA